MNSAFIFHEYDTDGTSPSKNTSSPNKINSSPQRPVTPERTRKEPASLNVTTEYTFQPLQTENDTPKTVSSFRTGLISMDVPITNKLTQPITTDSDIYTINTPMNSTSHQTGASSKLVQPFSFDSDVYKTTSSMTTTSHQTVSSSKLTQPLSVDSDVYKTTSPMTTTSHQTAMSTVTPLDQHYVSPVIENESYKNTFSIHNIVHPTTPSVDQHYTFEKASPVSTRSHTIELNSSPSHHHNSHRIPELESKVGTLTLENQRLTQEIETWKQKYVRLEQSHLKSSSLAHENERLTSEIHRLQREVTMLESAKIQNNQLVIQVQSLNDEKSKFSIVLAEKDKEILELRSKLGQIDQAEHKLSLVMMEKDRLTHTVNDKQREIESLKMRIGELERESSVIVDLKGKLSHAKAEIKRLTDIIAEKDAELQELLFKVQQILQIEQKFTMLISEKERLTNLNNEKTREIEQLVAKVTGLERAVAVIPELQEKIRQLKVENEKFYFGIKEKMDIIRTWESKYASLQALYQNVKEATEELDMIKHKYENAVHMSEKVEPRLKLSVDTAVSRKTQQQTDVNRDVDIDRTRPVSPKHITKASFDSSSTGRNPSPMRQATYRY